VPWTWQLPWLPVEKLWSQHGVPWTWQLPWLAIEKHWSALAGPFLTLLAQTGSGTNPLPL